MRPSPWTWWRYRLHQIPLHLWFLHRLPQKNDEITIRNPKVMMVIILSSMIRRIPKPRPGKLVGDQQRLRSQIRTTICLRRRWKRRMTRLVSALMVRSSLTENFKCFQMLLRIKFFRPYHLKIICNLYYIQQSKKHVSPNQTTLLIEVLFAAIGESICGAQWTVASSASPWTRTGKRTRKGRNKKGKQKGYQWWGSICLDKWNGTGLVRVCCSTSRWLG